MAFSAGDRLGPYEVLAPLGAGGMGEVWKARDARLGREVAIKVLPPSFSRDPDRLRRFGGGHDERDPHEGTARSRGDQPKHRAGARAPGPPLSREESGGAIPLGA